MQNILHRWKCQTRFVVVNPGLCVLRCPWSAAIPAPDVLWGSGRWSMLAGCWCLCSLWYHSAQSPVRPRVCPGLLWALKAWTGCFLHCWGFCGRAGVWSSASLSSSRQSSSEAGRGHVFWGASNTLMTRDFSNTLSQPRVSSLSKKSKVRLDGKNGCSFLWYQYLSCKTKAGETLSLFLPSSSW